MYAKINFNVIYRRFLSKQKDTQITTLAQHCLLNASMSCARWDVNPVNIKHLYNICTMLNQGKMLD